MKKLADIFPAVIAVAPPDSTTLELFTPRGASPQGTRRVDRCRVIVTEKIILVAIDSESGPKTVFKENLAYFSKSEDKIYRVKTETGKIISFTKQKNCQCGSRLGGWNPIKEIYSDAN